MIRHRGIVSLVFVALLLFAGWSAWQWDQALAEVNFAQDQLVKCRRLASRIEDLRQAPAQYDETQRSSDALSQLVEAAARQADIDVQRIASISPAEPRRLGDTPYKEQETRVELFEVTLPQLVTFMLTVPEADSAMHVGTMFMRTPVRPVYAPDQGEVEETWNAELILTSRFYAPIVAPSR